jgi:hypothetical protein
LLLQVQGRRDSRPVMVEVATDVNGRYEVAGLEREYLSVIVQPQDRYLSPCGVRLWLWNDEPKDVHVVSRTTLLSSGKRPTACSFARRPCEQPGG